MNNFYIFGTKNVQFFKNSNDHFYYRFFNACHKLQFQKNLMKRFKNLKSVDFRPTINPITHFENNTNFIEKPKQSLLPTH